MKDCKKGLGSHGLCSGETVVTYFFCGEEIPYRRTMKSHNLTLGHFKEQLRKKGNYRCVEGNFNTPTCQLHYYRSEMVSGNLCLQCGIEIVGNKMLSVR